MRSLILLAVVSLVGCGGGSHSSDTPAGPAATPGTPVVPVAQSKPLVVLFSADADSTLNGTAVDDGLVPALRSASYPLFSLDLPCHSTGNSVGALACWRTSIEAGDTDFFTRFCRELSRQLTVQGVTTAIAIGQSRGAYVAVTCAAYELRFSKVVMLKPVTNLQRLSEFNGYAVDQSVFGLDQYQSALAGRPVSIIIGANDTRVGTESAVAFAHLVNATLEIADSEDHHLPDGGVTTAWVMRQIE